MTFDQHHGKTDVYNNLPWVLVFGNGVAFESCVGVYVLTALSHPRTHALV
eukprot:m.6772 g.6772  ORF g.6772 m.6772 type:complete len:50 (+) comp2220_c0_seq1:45-194(+)